MPSQSWWQELACIEVAGTLYNTYTTSKSLLTSATATEASNGLTTLWPGFFRRGTRLRLEALLGVSNIVTTPGTMNFQVKIGGVTCFDTGNVVLTTTAHTLTPVWLEIDLTCRAVGNGTLTTLMGTSRITGLNIQQAGTTAAADTVVGCSAIYPATAPAVGGGFDNTGATNTVDLFGGFSVSNAGNGLQLQKLHITSCNNSAP